MDIYIFLSLQNYSPTYNLSYLNTFLINGVIEIVNIWFLGSYVPPYKLRCYRRFVAIYYRTEKKKLLRKPKYLNSQRVWCQ